MVGTWASLVIGVVFLALYARRVTGETFSMSQALTATQLALGREQRLTSLGGVVAAAAHELGTPLATIKVASSELVDELADRPDLLEDALLIRAQADRCRDILRTMGPRGRRRFDDAHGAAVERGRGSRRAARRSRRPDRHPRRGRVARRRPGAPARDRAAPRDRPGVAQPRAERRRFRARHGLDRPRLDLDQASRRDRRRRPRLSAPT